MINLRSVKHSWHRLLFFGLLGALMLISACDDYNIVEPRFYSEDDVVQIVECGFDPYPEPEDGAGYRNTIGVVQSKEVPATYSVDACWLDRAEGELAIVVGQPSAGPLRVSVLNSGGGVEAVLVDDMAEAGHYAVPWIVEEDGVYAISAQTQHTTMVVWFEVVR